MWAEWLPATFVKEGEGTLAAPSRCRCGTGQAANLPYGRHNFMCVGESTVGHDDGHGAEHASGAPGRKGVGSLHVAAKHTCQHPPALRHPPNLPCVSPRSRARRLTHSPIAITGAPHRNHSLGLHPPTCPPFDSAFPLLTAFPPRPLTCRHTRTYASPPLRPGGRVLDARRTHLGCDYCRRLPGSCLPDCPAVLSGCCCQRHSSQASLALAIGWAPLAGGPGRSGGGGAAEPGGLEVGIPHPEAAGA